ncbi:MAG: hypothetical protein AB9879_11990 [Methanothrix sp.]
MGKSVVGRSLVIDACIAHACCSKKEILCGDDSGRICRNFLQSIYENTKICIVMTKRIDEEWKKHTNKFSLKWIRWMYGSKRVFSPTYTFETKLREKIESNGDFKDGLSIMLKDLHLVDAAIASDKIITSLDDTSRYHFAKASQSIIEIRDITWVNPLEGESSSDWLLKGALPEEKRFIINFKDSQNR